MYHCHCDRVVPGNSNLSSSLHLYTNLYKCVKISIIVVNPLSTLAKQSSVREREHAEELVCTENACYGEVTSGKTHQEQKRRCYDYI